MLADAVAAGLVKKSISAADARRTELDITPAGQRMLRAARGWQEDVFRRLVADWTSQDADQFAGYLARLASQRVSPQVEEKLDDDRP